MPRPPYTTTYVTFGRIFTYTYKSRTPTSTSTYRLGGNYPIDDDAVRAAISGYVIALGELPTPRQPSAHMLVMYFSCDFRSSDSCSRYRCHRVLQAAKSKKGK